MYLMWWTLSLSGSKAASLHTTTVHSSQTQTISAPLRDTFFSFLCLLCWVRECLCSCTVLCLSLTCLDLSYYPAQNLKQRLMLMILSPRHKGLLAVCQLPDGVQLFFLSKQILTHMLGVFIKCTVFFFHHEKRLSKGKAIHSPPPNEPNSQLHQLCLLTRSFEGIDCWEGGQSRSDVHIPDKSGAE